MDRIVELIKIAAVDAVEAEKPTAVMLGIAESGGVIAVEQRLKLPQSRLHCVRGVELSEGDKVVLLRLHGGQDFVVIGVLE